MVHESIKKIEEHMKETQRLVEEAKSLQHRQEPANICCYRNQMKLVSVKPATNGKNKYTATFLKDNGRTKTTNFGAKGADDYTLGASQEQRTNYKDRHAKDLETKDPTRAGHLSYYILWGDSTSLRDNVRSYKDRFNL